MTSFTPVSGAIGGALIGIAASLLVLLQGRILGVSGILGGTLTTEPGNKDWRLAFLVGLVVGPLLTRVVHAAPDPIRIDTSVTLLIAAGLLVGLGTRLGGGCTSGHGVCGLARGSARSLAATATLLHRLAQPRTRGPGSVPAT